MIELEILKSVPLFQGLNETQLVYLQPLFKLETVHAGAYIIKENTSGDRIYLLTDGCVQVTKDLVKGFDEDQASTEKVLATLCGESLPTFGENGVLGHGDRVANIVAKTDCQLYTLNQGDFEKFASQSYQGAYIVMTNIARKIASSLKSTDENLVKLATALYIAVQQ